MQGCFGGRRFWPVACGSIDIDRLARDRDSFGPKQRRDLTRARFGGWETGELAMAAAQEQADRFEGEIPGKKCWRGGVKTGEVSPFRTSCRAVSTSQRRNRHKRIKTALARFFRMLGWERYRERQGVTLECRYRRVGT